MENVDANIMGRAGYDLLVKQKLIPEKKKIELTESEKSEISKRLQKFLIHNTQLLDFDNTDINETSKTLFMGILISSVLAFVNDVDINSFMSIKTKDKE